MEIGQNIPASEIDATIRQEIELAERRYGDFSSTHEAYGVLAEEMAELLEAIRSNKSESIREECVQVAAVATRFAYCLNSVPMLKRSGCA